jgi:mRNA interferase MazF
MTKSKVVLVPFPFKTNIDLLETDVFLDINDENFNVTGLRLSSIIRLHRLMTVTTSLICRELGELSPEMKKQVDERLWNLFDLNRN